MMIDLYNETREKIEGNGNKCMHMFFKCIQQLLEAIAIVETQGR